MIARKYDLSRDQAEEQFIRRLKEGSNNAWIEMLNRFDPVIYSIAKQILPSKELDDLVQEVHIQLYRTINKYDSAKAALATWVMLLTRRRCIDRLRKTRRAVTQIPLEECFIEESDSANLDIGNTKKIANQVNQYMQEFTPDQQKVLKLAYVKGLSQREIGIALNMPLGTVKTHTYRGMKELRKHFDTPEYREILDLS